MDILQDPEIKMILQQLTPHYKKKFFRNLEPIVAEISSFSNLKEEQAAKWVYHPRSPLDPWLSWSQLDLKPSRLPAGVANRLEFLCR